MAKIVFTQQLRRFTDLPEVDAAASMLRDAMETAFGANPRLRCYLLDEQGHLRPNVAIFIDGRRVRDHVRLDDALEPNSIVHVLQALSGG
jgi:molybdopterin synthase sulfur carrier subunit